MRINYNPTTGISFGLSEASRYRRLGERIRKKGRSMSSSTHSETFFYRAGEDEFYLIVVDDPARENWIVTTRSKWMVKAPFVTAQSQRIWGMGMIFDDKIASDPDCMVWTYVPNPLVWSETWSYHHDLKHRVRKVPKLRIRFTHHEKYIIGDPAHGD